jgi:glucose-1-phosphate cytidylyltransferase
MTDYSAADIPVVILAGGRGTRLSEMTHEIPKPMVPIGEYPMLLHIMRYYSFYGHKKFVICLGYLGSIIKDYFLNIERHTSSIGMHAGQVQYTNSMVADWEIHLVETGADALTGTRLSRVRDYLTNEHFCLTYGDGLSDLPLDKELAFHLNHRRIGTVAAVHPPARFGSLEIDENNEVRVFEEKQPLKHDYINGGFFIFRKQFLDYVHSDENESLEGESLTSLAREGQLSAFRHSGFWQCMDTLRDVDVLRELYEGGRAPWTKRAITID